MQRSKEFSDNVSSRIANFSNAWWRTFLGWEGQPEILSGFSDRNSRRILISFLHDLLLFFDHLGSENLPRFAEEIAFSLFPKPQSSY
jgi:hypothetical protein